MNRRAVVGWCMERETHVYKETPSSRKSSPTCRMRWPGSRKRSGGRRHRPRPRRYGRPFGGRLSDTNGRYFPQPTEGAGLVLRIRGHRWRLVLEPDPGSCEDPMVSEEEARRNHRVLRFLNQRIVRTTVRVISTCIVDSRASGQTKSAVVIRRKISTSSSPTVPSRTSRSPIPRPCYYTVRVTDVRGGRGLLAVHEG